MSTNNVQSNHEHLRLVETVTLGEGWVSPEAAIFGEPGRGIVIGDNYSIEREVFLHGPITMGDNVVIAKGASIDGGSKGVVIGDNVHIGEHARLYAFDHGMEAHLPIFKQAVRSRGIVIGDNVRIGARACITDGVAIGANVVIAENEVVSRNRT